MAMRPFSTLFPEEARADARALIVRWPQGALPKDDFVLVEYYCTSRDCDCRRVVLGVVRASTRVHVATLSHAFEPAPAGETTLDPQNPQSALAEELLVLFRETLGQDARYVGRLVEHERMFRAVVDDPAHPDHGRLHAASSTAPPPAPPPAILGAAASRGAQATSSGGRGGGGLAGTYGHLKRLVTGKPPTRH